MHYLSSIDAFGIQPSLLIKSKPRHRSFFGGILSIFLGILLASCVYYFGKELILKESPSVNLSSEFQDHPTNLSYFDRFEFLLTLQYNYMPTVDKTKYYTRAFIFQTIKDESTGGTTNFLRPIFAVSTTYKSDLLSYDFISTSFDLKEFASLFQNDLEFHIEQLLVIYPKSLCQRAFEITIDKVTKYGEFPLSSVSEFDIHYGKISSLTYKNVEKVGIYRKFTDIEIRMAYKTKKGYMAFNSNVSYILATSLSLSFGEFKKISTVGVLIIKEMLNRVYNSIINKS